jgi:hypothetical protein
MGLVFIGVALIGGLADDPAEAFDSWPLPTLLIVAGVVGLAGSLLRRRSVEDR